MPLLELKDISRIYEMASEAIKALDGVDLCVDESERIILLGPSGSGKTTLLNCISALDSPTSGTYKFNDVEVPRNKAEQMTTFRRENIGYVFQFFNLLQDLTVLENILLIQELAGGRDVGKARHLLELVELSGEADRFPAEISGGQQQRVATASSSVGSTRANDTVEACTHDDRKWPRVVEHKLEGTSEVAVLRQRVSRVPSTTAPELRG